MLYNLSRGAALVHASAPSHPSIPPHLLPPPPPPHHKLKYSWHAITIKYSERPRTACHHGNCC